MRMCALGDNVVDRYVDRGVMYPGGNAVNVAVHARRCGAETAYLGALGDDAAGQLLVAALEAENVELTRTRVLRGDTAHAVVRLVDGDRVFEDGSLGVSRFVPSEADLAYLTGFDLVHTGDCSGLEDHLAAIAAVSTVSFDFSNQPVTYAEPLLKYVSIATFSASQASDSDIGDLVRWSHALGPRQVLVTRGAAGAVLSTSAGLSYYGTTPITVVDTLGAGDAFIARMLVELNRGVPEQQALAAASEYAGQTCQYFGAFGYEASDSFGIQQ
jgi:fructoselysine 6-kinase